MSHKIGILGTGHIAHKMASTIAQMDGYENYAVASRSQDKACQFAAQYQIPHAYGSYEALAADPEVDIVYVATPHSRHYADMKLLIGAGKHILCEKSFTTDAAQAVERVGMPEAQIILSQAVTYVATAPKSNSACIAVYEAMEAVKTRRSMPVPPHLKDAHYRGAESLGHGLDYKYAHDYPNHYVKQQYLPDGMEGTVFYRPSENGYEQKISEHMRFLKSYVC